MMLQRPISHVTYSVADIEQAVAHWSSYLALCLASDESSWVTGQNYSIDGGVTAGFR